MRTGRDGHRPSAVRRGRHRPRPPPRRRSRRAGGDTGPLQPDHDRKLHRHHVLHVTAPRPQTTSSTTSPPTGPGPRGCLDQDDVEVAEQDERQLRSAGGRVGRQPRETAAPARIVSRTSAAIPAAVQHLGAVASGSGFAAGRVPPSSGDGSPGGLTDGMRMRARRWAIASSASAPAARRSRLGDRCRCRSQCVAERAFSVRPGPPPVDEPRHADVGCEQEDRGQKQDGKLDGEAITSRRATRKNPCIEKRVKNASRRSTLIAFAAPSGSWRAGPNTPRPAIATKTASVRPNSQRPPPGSARSGP